MGLLDRFRSQWERRKKAPKHPKHAVSSKERAEEAKKASFRSVPGAAGGGAKTPSIASKKPKREDTGAAYRILVRPLVSEKSTRLAVMAQYVFEVRPEANKVEIRRAVRSLYGVDPVRVNILNFPGKAVRYGRTSGRTKHWKKAVVTLKPGTKIDPLEA